MKMKSLIIKVFVLVMCFERTSCLLLSGLMFQHLVGNFIARQVFPSLLSSTFQSFASPSSFQTFGGPSSSTTVTTSNNNPITAMVDVANALGLNRRFKSYMKDVWPEIECEIKPCKGKKKKRNSRKQKTEEKETTESDELAELHQNTSQEDAEMEEYKIKDDLEVEQLADEELAEENPLHFYYAMKDKQKRYQEEKMQQYLEESFPQNGPIMGRHPMQRADESPPDAHADSQDKSEIEGAGPGPEPEQEHEQMIESQNQPQLNFRPRPYQLPLFIRYPKALDRSRVPRITVRLNNPFRSWLRMG